MIAPSFEEEVDRYHLAVPEITRGNPGPVKELYSRLDDVTLANPFGGIARGWAQVEARLDQASRNYHEGEMLGFDTITSYTARDTAYLVETEHFRARMAGAPMVEEFALRVTSIFRREEGYWKLVHRHADPAAQPQSRRSLAQTATS
ncbi:nuclear transport factor 2 family protein [Arthrobacter sp. CDRTa11]|uniref:YybH family protein n=1 Tax=Arthrobacter sp. CDRTa11 TaxID=2651199 RepID=UPI0022658A43|nr:nuclear transport factor 2 family protein [Arthrobacter sp. CDRTa11]UZX02420.1 nuclear transport factor 2 family protein [Arthrobacter sp. CDRTa11]